MRAVLRIRKEPAYRRAAFEQGLKRVGFVLDDKLARPSGPEDWLVLWNRQNDGERDADLWEQHGGTVIVAENGYLQKVDKTYYAIAVHGHNGSGWHPVGDEDRFGLLGFELKPWRSDNHPGYELVIAQRGIGSHVMRSPPQWAEMKARKLRGHNVIVRPHPGNFAPKVPLVDVLRGAAACHIWSSAAGVMALVEGVPVYHSAPHWIGDGAGPFTREIVLNRVAHAQWHHEEIAQGTPFARVIEHRKEAVW
jgi:hypothetical protein